MLVLIAFLSIANRNHAEKLVIKSNSLQNEVKELRSQAISTSSELMKFSRQTTVERIVRERGLDLEENLEPSPEDLEGESGTDQSCYDDLQDIASGPGVDIGARIPRPGQRYGESDQEDTEYRSHRINGNFLPRGIIGDQPTYAPRPLSIAYGSFLINS